MLNFIENHRKCLLYKVNKLEEQKILNLKRSMDRSKQKVKKQDRNKSKETRRLMIVLKHLIPTFGRLYRRSILSHLLKVGIKFL